jgi:erythronate-4-phosphate dehydrogenase
MRIIADAKIPHAVAEFTQFGDVLVLPTKAITREAIRDADAILIRSETKVTASLLEGTRVRFVGTATIGTDHVDLEYLQRHNIAFASCPGSNANSVAEYVLAALLELGAMFDVSLRGKTLGIVGHGNTGSRTARKAEALGMRVLLNDPPLARTTGDPKYLSLDALMEADIISLHVPLTRTGEDATYHLFDERRLSAMKRGATLINTSRGAVVESESLKRLLKAGHLHACVLDVWENEPMIDCELLELTTIGTPHIAGYSHDGKLNATRMLQEALSKFCGVPFDASAQRQPDAKNRIVLPAGEPDAEKLLRHAVRACYDIRKDDQELRKMLTLPADERDDYFRHLRASYPVRREFHNFVLDGQALDLPTANLFRAMGFCVQ